MSGLRSALAPALLTGLALVGGIALAAGPSLGAEPEKRAIAGILDALGAGRDPLMGPHVMPAQSLATHESRAQRIAAANARMAQEIDRVVTAFKEAPEAQKAAATRAAVAAFDKETAADGASRQFEGRGPSLSIMRQMLLLRTDQIKAPDPAARVIDVVSSFERSPKTDDDYFEYSSPTDLKGSKITELAGSKTSWTTAAQPSMQKDTLYAQKKCRHIVVLGWYCNTSLYSVRDAPAPLGGKLLLTALYPLPRGHDNRAFTDDRAVNIVDGYTALYVVVPSGGMVLVYNLGIQDKAAAPSHTGRLNDGHKEEYRQLVTRLKADLGAAVLVP